MFVKQTAIIPTLASRFLLSKASDRFLSLITWVSVTGVALGVLALTVVTSVINGFEGELSKVITGMNGDVIFYSRAEPVSEPDKIEARIRKVLPNVQAITATFDSAIMAGGLNGVSGAVLEGIDPETISEVTAIPKRVVEGRLPNESPRGSENVEFALGSSLADRIGAIVGSEIRLIIPFTENLESASESIPPPKVIKGRVVGIVKMGMYEYDSKFIFSALSSVQNFMGQPGRVTSFKIKLLPGADSRLASDRLTDNFAHPFRAKDWAQLNKNLFYAIKLEKAVIAIILTTIVIVAAFNVVSTLMMMIHDKTKEIAILKAMGFRPDQGFGLFCLIGLGVGVVGTGLGIALGMGVNAILSRTHWIDLPPEIYYIGFLPVVIRWHEIGVIALMAMLISLAATLYPAWKVARRSPLDGLRYE